MTVSSAALAIRRRRRWVFAGLGIYLAAALVVLLSPVSPEAIVAAVTTWLRDDAGLSSVRQGWVEFAANIALFAPLGALVTLVFRRGWAGVVVALVLSAGVELAQTLLPGRLASPRDVLANVLGAAVGAAAVLVLRAARRARRRT